jgi:hypothetical protein
MTNKELREQLETLPDDYVICGTIFPNTTPYEISSFETEEGHTYYAATDDKIMTNNLIVF